MLRLSAIARETRAKERLERDIEEVKQQMEAKQGEIKDQEADLAACEASIHRLEQSLREQDVRPHVVSPAAHSRSDGAAFLAAS